MFVRLPTSEPSRPVYYPILLLIVPETLGLPSSTQTSPTPIFRTHLFSSVRREIEAHWMSVTWDPEALEKYADEDAVNLDAERKLVRRIDRLIRPWMYLCLSTALYILLGYQQFLNALGLSFQVDPALHATGIMQVALWSVMKGETSVEAQDHQIYRKVALTKYIISDGIVVWRAWIMFPESRVVKLTLLFCMGGSSAAGFVDAGLSAAQTVKNLASYTSKFNVLILGLPLLFTNMIATLLIGYKTWYHYQDVKKNLSNSGTSSRRVQKVLLLLIESGSMYCILWIVNIIMQFKYDGDSTIFQCWATATPELSALYPVLIVVIAAAENAKPATIDEMSLSQSIRFASGQASSSEGHRSMTESQSNPPATTTLSEAENTVENLT
ncbi:hypothetical protein K435DRAFT_871547 [Dendrothele bispora CBS 962.96]|uniref:Uncharacterized protein n=1 Tax=Dendrothele bispora (strain CBS 962.96) TaxID=1314807 RepID=A0A4S8L565_DENBC|nr:hypothetical protein K435DRAFT_871547 [Dendrothele bispora CBS 962.96]